MINAPQVSSNSLSPQVSPSDLTQFVPAVQKALQKLQLLRDWVSIKPIIKRIANWESPLEQVFYVTFLSLKIGKRIGRKIRLEEQYRIASGGRWYAVDFRLSLDDEMSPNLDPFIAFIECDSRAFHDRTSKDVTRDRQRWRELQRQGGNVYAFTGEELLKNPEKCVIECVGDLQRKMIARRELLMQAFL